MKVLEWGLLFSYQLLRSDQMSKTHKLYQVREFVGSCYSKQLGQKLREKTSATRIARALKKTGRAVFIAPVSISK